MPDLITTFSTLQQARRASSTAPTLRAVGAGDVPTDVIASLRKMDLLAPGDVPWSTRLPASRDTVVYRIELGWGVVCFKRELACTADPAGLTTAERAAAEAAWFRAVCAVQPGAAPAVFGVLAGGADLAMEYLEPDEFPSWRSRLAAGAVEPWVAAEVGHVLGRLHAASANSSALKERFAPQAAFRALRLAPLEALARQSTPEPATALRRLTRDLPARRMALVHGALAPDNVLLGPRGPVLIDADAAHCGDPMFDVASCLAFLAQQMVAHARLRPELGASFDAFHRSYFTHVTWEIPDYAETRATALIPALLAAALDDAAEKPVGVAADRKRARAAALGFLAAPAPRLDQFADRWLEAVDHA